MSCLWARKSEIFATFIYSYQYRNFYFNFVTADNRLHHLGCDERRRCRPSDGHEQYTGNYTDNNCIDKFVQCPSLVNRPIIQMLTMWATYVGPPKCRN